MKHVRPSDGDASNTDVLSIVGGFQVKHPIGSALLVAFLSIVFFFLGTLSGGTSQIYNLFHSSAPLTTPEQFYLDACGGICLALTLLIVSAVAQARGIDVTFRSTTTTYLKGSIDKMTDFVEQEFRDTLQLRQGILRDEALRKICIQTTKAIIDELTSGTPSERILRESIIEGYRDRFVDVSKNLSSFGAFMDPRERRELTKKLFEHSGSYTVIMTDCHPISGKDHPTAWHEAYLAFVQDASKNNSKEIAWVFLVEKRESSQHTLAIKQVLDMGVSCYVLEYGKDRGNVIGGNEIDQFLKMGLVIEIFSADFRRSLASRSSLQPTAVVPWKSTAFRTREGRAISARAAHVLSMSDAISVASGQSVWACEEVAKLIRAGTAQASTDTLFHTFNYICESSVLEKKPSILSRFGA